MEKLIMLKEPTGQVAEAYRALSTNIIGLKEIKVIEVVSVEENSDANMVAANLAVAIAQTGRKVLLMDCNLRNPQQHIIFELKNYGFADYIRDRENFNDYVQDTQQSNLFVLTAGTKETNPAEILHGALMQEVLQLAKAEYDVVFLVAPPANNVSDAIVLGAKTDGVLLVLTNKEDKVKQVNKTKELFDHAGAKILGCVLNKAQAK